MMELGIMSSVFRTGHLELLGSTTREFAKSFCSIITFLSFQMKKHSDILSQLQDLEIQLEKALESVHKLSLEQDRDNEDDEDALDAFMMKLSTPASDKKYVARIKVNFLIHMKVQYIQ